MDNGNSTRYPCLHKPIYEDSYGNGRRWLVSFCLGMGETFPHGHNVQVNIQSFISYQYILHTQVPYTHLASIRTRTTWSSVPWRENTSLKTSKRGETASISNPSPPISGAYSTMFQRKSVVISASSSVCIYKPLMCICVEGTVLRGWAGWVDGGNGGTTYKEMNTRQA